jgi:hypothetical protein
VGLGVWLHNWNSAYSKVTVMKYEVEGATRVSLESRFRDQNRAIHPGGSLQPQVILDPHNQADGFPCTSVEKVANAVMLDQNLRWVVVFYGAARAGERDERETAACCAVRCLSPAPGRRSKSARHEATDLLPVVSLFFLRCLILYWHVSTLPLAVRLRIHNITPY